MMRKEGKTTVGELVKVVIAALGVPVLWGLLLLWSFCRCFRGKMSSFRALMGEELLLI